MAEQEEAEAFTTENDRDSNCPGQPRMVETSAKSGKPDIWRMAALWPPPAEIRLTCTHSGIHMP